ncbi:hypothetical protein [Natrarchaeobius halalkaliphilus]|uniref:hypothetical protein n=1 Tax=Natrarchaeobius halalkaliphilus TaxID=1679091 RepID=UPI00140429D7|nr:hypothetical protein [Natrarchaeobius halalkaliphilus]
MDGAIQTERLFTGAFEGDGMDGFDGRRDGDGSVARAEDGLESESDGLEGRYGGESE